MKTRLEIAKQINYKGLIGRTIVSDSRLNFKEGEEYKFYKEVESWAGENCTRDFIPEIEGKYVYYFTCDDVEGHEVNYEDNEECEILDCFNCEDEGEVLITNNHKFIIERVSNDEGFKEMGYYEIQLKEI